MEGTNSISGLFACGIIDMRNGHIKRLNRKITDKYEDNKNKKGTGIK